MYDVPVPVIRPCEIFHCSEMLETPGDASRSHRLLSSRLTSHISKSPISPRREHDSHEVPFRRPSMMLSDEQDHPSLIAGAGNRRPAVPAGALFTSTSVPPSPGLAGSCQLPFGCILSAFADVSGGDESNGMQNASLLKTANPIDGDRTTMNICLNCLAHLNPYCQYDASSGHRWTCSICGYEDNVVSDPAIFADNSVSSPLVSNIVEYVQRASGADADADVGGCSYVFVVDSHLPSAEVRCILRTVRSAFEKKKNAANSQHEHDTIGLIIFGKTVSVYQLGLRAGLASADVYPASSLVDNSDSICEGRSYVASLSSGGVDAFDRLDRCLDAHFDLTPDVDIDGTSSTPALAPMSRREMLRQKREERVRREARAAGTGKRSGASATASAAGAGKHFSARQARRKRRSEREKRRCTGAAVNLAISLISASSEELTSCKTGRILVLTNGCPNFGSGSVVSPIAPSPMNDGNQRNARYSSGVVAVPASPGRKGSPRRQRRSVGDIVDPAALAEASAYCELLGKDAFEAGIGIDVFCSGSTALGMPAFLALVRPSDGFALTHETFASGEAAANLRHVLGKTHISKAGKSQRTDGTPNTSGDTTKLNKLAGCLLDIRCPMFLSPTSVVGPGVVEYDDERSVLANEQGSYAHGAQRAAANGLPTNNLPSKDTISMTLTRLRLGRFDRLATHTLMMQVNDDIRQDDQHATFQFVARFVTSDGNYLVTRVFTHRLPVADMHQFLAGQRSEVVAICLGREAVFRATAGRGSTGEEEVTVVDRDRDEELSNDARKDIDATIHLASAAFRLLGSRSGGSSTNERSLAASSLDFAFPPELVDALRGLYALRRGPLLGTGPQLSSDDRCVSRSLFMHLPMSDCLPMISPLVWCCRTDANSPRGFTLESVPAVTLACWDEVSIFNV